jgi:hypothetical protein
LINTGSSFVDRSLAAGISGLQIASNAVVAGDFDNDGDQDLYIDQADQAVNGPNILLENQGDGTFVAISDAGGPTDTCVVEADRWQWLTMTGFLDIAVTNGKFSDEGWVKLLHNVGNESHWLKVKSIGNPSNRDAIGASVINIANGISSRGECWDPSLCAR